MTDITQTLTFNIQAKVEGGTDTLDKLKNSLKGTGAELKNLDTTFIGFEGAHRKFNHNLVLEAKNALAFDNALRALGVTLNQLKQVESRAFDEKNQGRLKVPYRESVIKELDKQAKEALSIYRKSSKDKLNDLALDVKEETGVILDGGQSKLAIMRRYAAQVAKVQIELNTKLLELEKDMVRDGTRAQDALINSPQAKKLVDDAKNRILNLANTANTAIVAGKADKLGLTNAISNIESYLAQLKTDMDADIKIHQYGADTIKGIEERRRRDIVNSRRATARELAELRREMQSQGVVTPDTENAYRIKAGNIVDTGKANQEKINDKARADKEIIEKEKEALAKREAQIEKFNDNLRKKYLADYGHKRAAAISGEDSIRTAIADAEAKIIVSTEKFEAERAKIEEKWRHNRYSSHQKFNAELGKIYVSFKGERDAALEEIKALRDRQDAHKELVNSAKRANKEMLLNLDASLREEDTRIKTSNNQRAVALVQLANKEASIRRQLADEIIALEKKVKNNLLMTEQSVATERAKIEQNYLAQLKQVRSEIIALEDKDKKVNSYNANLLEQIQHYTKIYLILGSIHAVMGRIRNIWNDIPKVGVELEATYSSLMATMGSPTEASKQLEMLKQEAIDTGIPLENLRETWRNFSASTKLSGESTKTTESIFKNLNRAMVTLHMSGDNVSHTFLAISQMFNKGKIQSEELVKQLANYIPGAFGSFALATGRTTTQLAADMKKGLVSAHKEIELFAEYLAKRFGGDAFLQARAGLQAAIGEYKSSITLLEEAVFMKLERSGKSALKNITEFVNKLTASVNDVDTFSQAIGRLQGALEALLVLAAGSALYRFLTVLATLPTPMQLVAVGATAVGGALAYTLIEAEGAAKNLSMFSASIDNVTEASKRFNEGKQIDLKDSLDRTTDLERIAKEKASKVLLTWVDGKPLEKNLKDSIEQFKHFYKDLGDTITVGNQTISKKTLEEGVDSSVFSKHGGDYWRTIYHNYFSAVAKALGEEKAKFSEALAKLPDTSKIEQGALWEVTGVDEKSLAAFDRSSNKIIEQLKLKLEDQYEAIKAKQEEIKAKAKADREDFLISQVSYSNIVDEANKRERDERLKINSILQDKIKLLQQQRELLTPSMKSEEARTEYLPNAVRFAESGLTSPYGTPTTGHMLNGTAYGAWQIEKGTWDTFLENNAGTKESLGTYEDNLKVLLEAEGKAVKDLTESQKKVMDNIEVVGRTIFEGYLNEFKDVKSAILAYRGGKGSVLSYYKEHNINVGEITPEQSESMTASSKYSKYTSEVLKNYAERATLSKAELGTLVLQTDEERLQLDSQKALSEYSKKQQVNREETLRLEKERTQNINAAKLKLEATIEALKESPEKDLAKFEKEHAKILELVNNLRANGTDEERRTAELLQEQYDIGKRLAETKGQILDIEQKITKEGEMRSFKESLINEKERSGTLSRWDAMQARDKLKNEQTQGLQESLDAAKREREKFTSKGEDVPERVTSDIEKWDEQLQLLQARSSETAQFIRGTLQSSFANSFKDFITGAKSGEDAMKSFAVSVLDSIAQIMAEKVAMQIIGGLFSLIPSGAAGASAMETTGFSNLSKNSAFSNFLLPSAKGNIFNNNSLVPFASGGVLTSPITFPMKNGYGLAGEAGPEAIMPLKRDKNGRLGVSGGGNSTHNVVNNISVTIEKYTGKDDPEATAMKIAEAMSRRIAKEEITKANRRGNQLNPITVF